MASVPVALPCLVDWMGTKSREVNFMGTDVNQRGAPKGIHSSLSVGGTSLWVKLKVCSKFNDRCMVTLVEEILMFGSEEILPFFLAIN